MKTTEISTTVLKERYAALKAEDPKLRIRNAAAELGVSELELLLCSIGEGVVRLKPEPQAILSEIHRMGNVMALTRNEYVVHERKGVYDNVSFMGESKQMGLAVNPDIDLRLFMADWKHVLATTTAAGNRTLYGIQFFDQYGEAIHKIYSTPDSDIEAYFDIVKAFEAAEQTQEITLAQEPLPEPEYTQDEAVEVTAFQDEWLKMEDTHHFFGMLKKYKLHRLQALRFAPEGYAQQLPNDTIVKMLEKASATALPIMIFVGNRSCIQIHTGTVNKIFPMDNWINVMDPMFNLHLNLDGVAQTWMVRKCTSDGIVTSIELYDQAGELIAYCFGERKPGKPELLDWRTLVAELTTQK